MFPAAKIIVGNVERADSSAGIFGIIDPVTDGILGSQFKTGPKAATEAEV